MAVGAFGSVGIISPLSPGSARGDALASSPSSGSVTFSPSGGIAYGGSGVVDAVGPIRWHAVNNVSSGAASWMRATVTAGTLSSGTAAVWLALSTAQSFVKGPATAGAASVTLTFEFATDAAGANIVSTTFGWQLSYAHTL